MYLNDLLISNAQTWGLTVFTFDEYGRVKT